MRYSTILIIGITSILLVGIYLWFDQKPPRVMKQTVFSVEFTRKQNREPQTMNAIKGQTVTINILSDVADEAHLHGYDLRQPLIPMKWVRMTFVAEHTGRFKLELHQREKVLGTIQIQPPR